MWIKLWWGKKDLFKTPRKSVLWQERDQNEMVDSKVDFEVDYEVDFDNGGRSPAAEDIEYHIA